MSKEASCEYCGGPIDPAKLHKYTGKRRPRFCRRECASKWRIENGAYLELSKAGNAAQAAYKAEHGHVPGYEQRKAALQRSDRTNNRPRRVMS